MSSRLADLIVSRSNQSVVPQVPANIGLDDFSRYASSRKKILIGPLGHFSVHGQEGEDARIQCVMLPTNLALSGNQEAKGGLCHQGVDEENSLWKVEMPGRARR